MEKPIQNLINEPSITYEGKPSRMELLELSRKGIRRDTLDELAKKLGIPMKQLAGLLPVTERTLQRRQPSELLSQAISEHAILIAETIAAGLNVFADETKFQRWVQEANTGLGGHKPLSLLDTAIGTALVKEELHKLEYGVYS